MMHRPTCPTVPTSPWATSLGAHAHPPPHTMPYTSQPAEPPFHDPLSEHRLAMLERKEPTRRLVRDVIAIRRLRKLSQAALADELGVSKRTWQEWEQGRRLPSGVGRALLERWASEQAEWSGDSGD
ncbi:helix-turn-helix domain-containing protein [Vreelandella aquamarina]|nr:MULTISPECIES: helix-turn-helix domain-containing protein [Halomonas]